MVISGDIRGKVDQIKKIQNIFWNGMKNYFQKVVLEGGVSLDIFQSGGFRRGVSLRGVSLVKRVDP